MICIRRRSARSDSRVYISIDRGMICTGQHRRLNNFPNIYEDTRVETFRMPSQDAPSLRTTIAGRSARHNCRTPRV